VFGYTLGFNWNSYGDDLEVFIPKAKGVRGWHGVRTLWIEEYGIGKTPEEAIANYKKFLWIRSKQTVKIYHQQNKIKVRE